MCYLYYLQTPSSGIPLKKREKKKKGKNGKKRDNCQSIMSYRPLPLVCTSACRELRAAALPSRLTAVTFSLRWFLGTSRDTRVRSRATRQRVMAEKKANLHVCQQRSHVLALSLLRRSQRDAGSPREDARHLKNYFARFSNICNIWECLRCFWCWEESCWQRWISIDFFLRRNICYYR